MPSCQESSDVSQDDLEPSTEMLRQPETRPKSYDQLVAEMKDLSRREPLEDKQWHSLFALNKLRSWARRLGWLALQDGVDKISQHLSVSSQRLDPKQKDQPRSKLQRLKRGIPGYVNGKRIAAFPDTGSAQNVVSAAFVKERGLHVRESAEAFKLGNSKITKSTDKLTKVPTWYLGAVTNLNLNRHRGLGMGICRRPGKGCENCLPRASKLSVQHYSWAFIFESQ